MENIDNVNYTVAEDLKKNITKGSKVSIASEIFSLYAFEELKKELKSIESLRFIYSSPAFLEEKIPREKKEFYIPRLTRERNLYGTEFEVKLRNTLTQKAISKEFADWIRTKCELRSNTSNRSMNTMINVESPELRVSYNPMDQFSTVGIGSEKGDSISRYTMKLVGPESDMMFRLFDQIWNDKEILMDIKEEVIERLSLAYEENSPEFIYYVTLYNIFKEFLVDISEDYLPNDKVGLKDSEVWKSLYSFQKDAVNGIIHKLDSFNGCILADSVGLGKTYTALAVIKYYELKNKNVLVLCPKKLSENWNLYRMAMYRSNPLSADRFRYDVLYHTDLTRTKGMSNGLELTQIAW